MKSYIVRVYRFAEAEPREITGMVEVVEIQKKIPFHDSAELLKILTDNSKKPGINNMKPFSPGAGI